MKKLENTIVPSLIAGGVGAGLFVLLYGNPGMDIPLGPIDVPAIVAVGATVAIGNAAGELLTQYVVPYIPQSKTFEKIEDVAIPVGMAGLSTYLAMRFLINSDIDFLPPLIVGGGGSLGGALVYSQIYGML